VQNLPGGQITHLPVQPRAQKYSASRFTQINFRTLAIPSHTGALRNVTNAERDAVDAEGAPDEST